MSHFYLPDTVQNNNGNLVPFGVLISGSFDDGHTQILIPAAYLPGPGAMLQGLEVQCQNNATINYLTLNITLSPTMATSLGSNFAANMPAPQPVLTATIYQ